MGKINQITKQLQSNQEILEIETRREQLLQKQATQTEYQLHFLQNIRSTLTGNKAPSTPKAAKDELQAQSKQQYRGNQRPSTCRSG